MSQKIQEISLSSLVLWTENPRDPIDAHATDQDVIDRAMLDKEQKWDLLKLAVSMGEDYDYSELPTVVFHGKIPIVYDGNRRVALGKMKAGLVNSGSFDISKIPSYPDPIPCNVCDQKTALNNVLRKHAESGSWRPLERDIFLNKYMGKEKSIFLVLDEATGLIRNNIHLNQRFVKEEIFREDILKSLGIEVVGDSIRSKHDAEQTIDIFEDISSKIRDKVISTRKKRGDVYDILNGDSKDLIDKNKKKPFSDIKIKLSGSSDASPKKERKTKRVKNDGVLLFGGDLFLKPGEVNNLYRDISDLHQYFLKNKERLSATFPSMIRMSLRLLCEAAGNDLGLKLESYVRNNFSSAKSELSQDMKTALSSSSVKENNIVELLHVGAHSYTTSKDLNQTLILSVIIGRIISLSHGKK